MSTMHAPRATFAPPSIPVAPTAVDSLPAARRRFFEARTALPVVRRETLVWGGGCGGTPLSVMFDAENPGDRPTRPVVVGLGVAAFGAFLPSRIVARVSVPLLLPGARRRIAVRLLRTALPDGPAGLLPELEAGGENRRWAGNLDLWMEGRMRVERHCADLRCLSPGVESIVAAFVHADAEDALCFAATTPGEGWRVRLHLGARGPLEAGEWVEAGQGMSMLLVGIRPPPTVEGPGLVTVTATRRSDGRSVPIEFSLAGPTGPSASRF